MPADPHVPLSKSGNRQPGGWLRRAEEVFFGVVVLGMVAGGLVQIVSRGRWEAHLGWVEPLSRHLVLWVCLFGAAAASGEHKHIRIDLISHLLPRRGCHALNAGTHVLAAVVTALLAWVSGRFVVTEASFSRGSSVFFGIPEWCLELVLPIGFAWISLRLLATGVQEGRSAVTAADDDRAGGPA